ncbi:DUF6220 domain-containing protein [Paenibacillus nasutitermitis]|uniref:Uncharacterized protein n=1 Tax=Paenibacillus nasutitermitis TaxID=1652958 RepID=A0A916ZC67_9BACL|nr:DUF6220 domain-containing protein [Paenibacillus nasutitermitis]GGD87408.1 hypothetical protein GCM10010911_52260 [Paenibacillus nasutitermitis]
MPINQAGADHLTEAEMRAKQIGTSYIRLAIFLLAALFALSVVMQVFLAGMASFADPAHWRDHRSFAYYFTPLPLAMLVLTFVGRTGKVTRYQSLGMFILIILQYVTAYMGDHMPMLAALHPVLALLLFWISIICTRQAFTDWRKGRV